MYHQLTRELTPQQPHAVPRWGRLFVAGPFMWFLYFWIEAQAAQMGCRVDAWPLMVWSSVASAGMVMVTVSYSASRSRSDGAHSAVSVMRDGFLLGAGLLAAAVLVGVPTLVNHPC
jgi:hypothetical protein